ncbi:hypothetical protein V6O07_08620, partial [Arthrospira platensis SPKY2]
MRDTTVVAEHALPMELFTVFTANGKVIGQDRAGSWKSMDPMTGAVQLLQRAGAWPPLPHKVVFGARSDQAYLHGGNWLYELSVDITGRQLHARMINIDLP